MIKERMREEYLSEESLSKIERLLPDERTLRAISSFYQLFGDATRVKIISALSINEMCVGDLALLLNMQQSTLSHQLKILRDYGIIDYRRSGKMIFYFVKSLLVDDVMSIGIENMKNRLMNNY